jgi:DNA-binding beta-propeller fold protein YncE
MRRIIFKSCVILFIFPTLLIAVDRCAYVLNSLGETISRINLTTGTVDNDIVTVGSDVGSYPNQIVIRDTLAFTVASGTDEIQIINLNTEQSTGFINVGAATNPYWMAFLDSQYVYITLMLSNSIARVDIINKTVVDIIPTGLSPAGIALANDKIYVVCSGYDFDTYTFNPAVLYVYDMSDHSLVTTVDVGINAQYAAVDSEGRIHVIATGDYSSSFGEIFIIDTDDDTVVDNITIGGSPGQISIGPDNIAYLAAAGWTMEGYVYSYHALTGEIYHSSGNPIEVDLNCMTAVAYQDSTIFTGSFTDYVNIIDSNGNVQSSYAVGSGPNHIAFNYLPGDANADFEINILDIIYIINWKYKNGPGIASARWRANVNADKDYNILDIVYLINALYKDGPPPKVGPDWIM